jgi:hypothetical protein
MTLYVGGDVDLWGVGGYDKGGNKTHKGGCM